MNRRLKRLPLFGVISEVAVAISFALAKEYYRQRHVYGTQRPRPGIHLYAGSPLESAQQPQVSVSRGMWVICSNVWLQEGFKQIVLDAARRLNKPHTGQHGAIRLVRATLIESYVAWRIHSGQKITQ